MAFKTPAPVLLPPPTEVPVATSPPVLMAPPKPVPIASSPQAAPIDDNVKKQMVENFAAQSGMNVGYAEK